MRQYTIPKIYYNKNRSFCFFYLNGKRIRIYNGKSIGENIYPNKLKKKAQVLDELNKLKNSLLIQLQNNWIPNSSLNQVKPGLKEEEENISTYEKSIFQERINLDIYKNSEDGSKIAANEIAELIRLWVPILLTKIGPNMRPQFIALFGIAAIPPYAILTL